MIRFLTSTFLTVLVVAITPTAANAGIGEDFGEGGGGGGGESDPPPPPAPGYWTKTFSKNGSFGTYSWGAGYNVSGKIAATPKSSPNTRDKLEASANANAYARLNGTHYKLFEVRAAGVTEARGRTDVSLTGYVGGVAMFSRSWASTTSTHTFLTMTPVTWPASFVDRSVNVTVGPVPVSFRVRATGLLKANVTGKISNAGIEMNVDPSGKASLYASAAIGGQYCLYNVCVGASAGVYADVTLVEVEAPAQAAVWWSLSNGSVGVLINHKLKGDVALHSLDGELGVFAEVSLGGTLRWDEDLIDWDGFVATYSLLNQSGAHCLSGTCSIGMPGLEH